MGLIYKNGILYTGGGSAGSGCTEYTLDGDIENGLTLTNSGDASVQTLDINADTGWLNAEVTAGAAGEVKYRRKNGIVYVDVNVYQISITGATLLATLPEGFRPVRTTYSAGVANNWNAPCGVFVYTDGTINGRAVGTGTTVNGIFTTLVFPVD